MGFWIEPCTASPQVCHSNNFCETKNSLRIKEREKDSVTQKKEQGGSLKKQIRKENRKVKDSIEESSFLTQSLPPALRIIINQTILLQSQRKSV